MSDSAKDRRDPELQPEIPHSLDDLQAMRAGVSALISPFTQGWAVQYVSGLEYETGSGTEFPSLDEALGAVRELLPKANSDEERARLREMEELAQLRQQLPPERHDP